MNLIQPPVLESLQAIKAKLEEQIKIIQDAIDKTERSDLPTKKLALDEIVLIISRFDKPFCAADIRNIVSDSMLKNNTFEKIDNAVLNNHLHYLIKIKQIQFVRKRSGRRAATYRLTNKIK